ncbi:MAG TPA: hypothetical protein DCX14_05965 [Flavobacteriales bacterium]|nr:hypothetical protein [Flavobacteriales bacterium]
MSTTYEKIEGFIETWCTWICAVSFALVYYVLFSDHVSIDKFNEMNKLVISVAAIGVGFIGTAKAILVSISESRVMKKIKSHKEKGKQSLYHVVLDYLFSGIWSCLTLVLLSTLYILIPLDSSSLNAVNLITLWFAFAGFSTAACVRVIVILGTVLKFLDKD